MLTAQTACAQINAFWLPVSDNRSWLDIRQPASLGMLFRVAYSVTKVCCFSTEFTFISQMINSFHQSKLVLTTVVE